MIFFIGLALQTPAISKENLSELDRKILELAKACQTDVGSQLENLIVTNKLTLTQLFDTFYIPIPNSNPQKFRTQYDKLTDDTIRITLDKYLSMNEQILFVVAVDRNGYLPTHNSKYSLPLTGDSDFDLKNNRTKRMFNDRTGLAAARNIKPYLLQSYTRDTGEMIMDMSVPLIIRDKHWGAIRIGYLQPLEN
jgi:methyl-accepting chemotaxis protein